MALLCALALVVTAVACFRGGADRFVETPKPITVSRFFTDPVQRRLADAVEQGNADAIAEAIRLGGDVDRLGREGVSMLTWAVLKGSVAGFQVLLSHNANLMPQMIDPERTKQGQRMDTIIEFVCTAKDKAFLKAALKHGFDPNRVIVPTLGETLLFRAVWRHDLEAAGILIDAGADVNQGDIIGNTPLALAQSINDYKMVMYLYSRGGDPTIKDNWGFDECRKLKKFGSRGVTPEQRPYFEEFVSELVSRGLLTRQDIVEADKPKTSGKPGVEIIYHEPDSEAGQAIRAMDRAEQEATRRGNN